MAPITTRFKPKPFTWSYSRLKNFESCPKKHFHVDIQKDVKEEESDQLMWGDAVHKAMAARIEKGAPLPKSMDDFEKHAVSLTTGPGKIFVEQKLAITADFEATEFFAGNVWFRAIGDVIKVNGRVALIGDWKTGKIVEDSVQLALAAQCVFAKFPEVEAVKSVFYWLKDDATTVEVFRRGDMAAVWNGMWARIDALATAHKTTEYPAKPGRLCANWCPVRQCAHYGT